jgi:hypothetical protein
MVALFGAALYLSLHCLNVSPSVLRSGGSGYYDQQEMDLSLDALEDYVDPLDMSLMHNRYHTQVMSCFVVRFVAAYACCSAWL